MKITAIIGTQRKNGVISTLCSKILEGARQNGHETQLINLYDKRIELCKGCWACNKKGKCFMDDDFHEIYEQLVESDVIIIGSPCYWGNITGIMKNFFDRHSAYMYQPNNIKRIKQMSFIEKFFFLKNTMKKFGPKDDLAGKKYITVVSGTLPFPKSHLSGDFPQTIRAIDIYIHKLKGKRVDKIIYTDTFFRFFKGKHEHLLKKAYRLGLGLK